MRGLTAWQEETQALGAIKAAAAIQSTPMPALPPICTEHIPSGGCTPDVLAKQQQQQQGLHPQLPRLSLAAYEDSSDEEDQEDGGDQQKNQQQTQRQLQQGIGGLSIDLDGGCAAKTISRRGNRDLGDLHRSDSGNSRNSGQFSQSREGLDIVTRRSSRDGSEFGSSGGSQGQGTIQQSPGVLSKEGSLGQVQGLVMESISEMAMQHEDTSMTGRSWEEQLSRRGAAWMGDDYTPPSDKRKTAGDGRLGECYGGEEEEQEQMMGVAAASMGFRGSEEKRVGFTGGAMGVNPCSSRQQQCKEWQQQQQQGLGGGSTGGVGYNGVTFKGAAAVAAAGGGGSGVREAAASLDGDADLDNISSSSRGSYTFPWLKLWCMVMVWLCFLALSTINSMLPVCSWQYVGFMMLFLVLTIGVTAMFIRVIIVGPEEGAAGLGGRWGHGWQGFLRRVQRWVKYRWQGGGREGQQLLDVEAQEEEERKSSSSTKALSGGPCLVLQALQT